MSVARSYTDFHVDFGGSSVFYHILRGNKTFLFIDPNSQNLRRYEAWCGDSDQSRRFLGEEVKECIRVDLSEGDTMIIPSGWIHAVYTPTDSLVLGGNFLTPLHIPSQLQIASIEARTRVPKKFRFPFFDMAMWYTAIYYLDVLVTRKKPGPKPKGGRRNTEGFSEYEVSGLKTLAEWLWKKAKLRNQQVARGSTSSVRVEVPPGIDAMDTATRFAKWVFEGEGGENGKEWPLWYRGEVLLEPVRIPKKRKAVAEGDDTPTPKQPRRYSKRISSTVDRRSGGGDDIGAIVTQGSIDYFSLSRPVTTYSNLSNYMTKPITNYSTGTPYKVPLVAYPLAKNLAKGPTFQIYKPYSQYQSKDIPPYGNSFVSIIKSKCRPYLRPPVTIVLEEIKVEEDPAIASPKRLTQPIIDEDLTILSETPELSSDPKPTATAHSSSPSETRRLPTPPSQSPPLLPSIEMVREATPQTLPQRANTASPVPKRKKPGPKPKMRNFSSSPILSKTKKTYEPSQRKVRRQAQEAERLQALLTEDELQDFRRIRRRGQDYIFSSESLKRELIRLGKEF